MWYTLIIVYNNNQNTHIDVICYNNCVYTGNSTNKQPIKKNKTVLGGNIVGMGNITNIGSTAGNSVINTNNNTGGNMGTNNNINNNNDTENDIKKSAVSGPYNVQHQSHVDINFEWKNLQDFDMGVCVCACVCVYNTTVCVFV